MKRAARRLLVQSLGILLTLILLLFSWMLFTQLGSNTSLQILQSKFNKFEYTYKAGTLATGLQLENVKWQLKNNTVVSTPSMQFHWNPRCWHAKELCISKISVDQLVIDIARGDRKTEVKNLAAINLPFSIIADSLQIGEIIINNATESPLIFSKIEFSGKLHNSKLTANRLKLDWLWLQADINGSMTMNRDYPVAATGTLISTDPALALPINSTWRLGGDLLSLQLNADFKAPYSGELAGTYSMLRRGLPADIKISWPTAHWPRLGGEPNVFVDKGSFFIKGTAPDYQTNATAIIHGNHIPSADITLNGKINSRKATFFPMMFHTLGGNLSAEGVFKWHNGLSWNASLSAHELWPDLYWPKLTGLINGTTHFSGRTHNGQTRLELNAINATGTMHGHRFRLTGDAMKDPFGVWHLSAIEAVNSDNQVYANGNIGVESDLKLLFNSQSIHKFVDNVYGDLHGDVSIRGNLENPDISGAVSSANLKIGDIQLHNVKSEGHIRQGGQKQSSVTAVAERVLVHSQNFHNTQLDLDGNLASHNIRLGFDHELGKAARLRVEGSFRELTDWQGKIISARGHLSNHPVALSQPFDIHWVHEKRSLALTPHCWTVNIADGCVTNTAMIGQTGEVHFSVNSLDLDNLKSLQIRPLSIAGLLNTKGKFSWGNNTAPRVVLSGNVSHATASITDNNNRERFKLPLDTLNINVATKRNVIKTDLIVKARRIGSLNLMFDIDTSSSNFPLSGSVALSNNDIKWLHTYLPDIASVEGQISANGIINGTLSEPLINGVISVNDGAVSSPSLPTDLANIELDIEFDNKTSRIRGSAKSGATPLQITGTSSLNTGSRITATSGEQVDASSVTPGSWSSTVNISADNLEIDTDLFRRAVVSPNLNIHVAESGVRIDGELDVHSANIVVNELAQGGVATSNDVIIVDASDNEKQAAAVSKQNFASEIDVSLGRRVRFNGFGLKADLSGDFHLALDANRPPELLGEIMVDNGTYRSYGQNLSIRDGRITFVGPLEQTGVTVEAVRKVDNILAGLRVDGSLKNPTTTLFSEPSLPKEEILSYVVLGRSLNFSSTDDSQMLTNAALFMGISNGRNFSQNIAENLGIEDFYLSATGTGDDTQVMLSGRLNKNLLVRYGVGVFDAVSTLFLRYDLAEQLYIETTQGLEKAIDIFYSFEF